MNTDFILNYLNYTQYKLGGEIPWTKNEIVTNRYLNYEDAYSIDDVDRIENKKHLWDQAPDEVKELFGVYEKLNMHPTLSLKKIPPYVNRMKILKTPVNKDRLTYVFYTHVTPNSKEAFNITAWFLGSLIGLPLLATVDCMILLIWFLVFYALYHLKEMVKDVCRRASRDIDRMKMSIKNGMAYETDSQNASDEEPEKEAVYEEPAPRNAPFKEITSKESASDESASNKRAKNESDFVQYEDVETSMTVRKNNSGIQVRDKNRKTSVCATKQY